MARITGHIQTLFVFLNPFCLMTLSAFSHRIEISQHVTIGVLMGKTIHLAASNWILIEAGQVTLV
jgi:hypothetical protein